jgi:Domain of unknown function (DUF222)
MTGVGVASGVPTAEVVLHDVIGVLLGPDSAGLDDDALYELVVRVQAERARLAVAAADLLAEWDSRRLWESDGSRTAGHRLARETHSSVRSSKAEIRRARRIRHLPATRAAVIDGRLSLDHLDLLGHANSPALRVLFERRVRTARTGRTGGR